MRTDGDRTKCLEVPLRSVRSDGDRALYAGVFYPFRAAAYDGKIRLGDDTFDIAFDVRAIAAGAPVAPQAATATQLPVAAQAELPVGSIEEPDAVRLPSDIGPLGIGLIALALWSCLAFAVVRVRAVRTAPA